MKEINKNKLLYDLHYIPSHKRIDFLQALLEAEHNTSRNQSEFIKSTLDEFYNSIGVLNAKQFESLIHTIKTEYSLSTVCRKLDLYNIKAEYFEPILNFCKTYHQNIDTSNFNEILSTDSEITLENFKKIMKQGWIGDWENNPEDDNLSVVKIPAFTKSGKKKRFFLAKILKTIPVSYKDKTRYRIYFLNPRIVIL